MVRVIGGRARGRRLQVPPGDRVRPTSDRVREALFNVLAHTLDVRWEGLRVLDLFAGAGTLGLEALSRGAAEVVFVEADRRVAEVLARNLAAVPGTSRLVQQPAERFLAGTPSPFDVVFLDPPYPAAAEVPTITALHRRGWLAPGSLVCVEHPAARSLDGLPDGLEEAFGRAWGASRFTIYREV